MRRRMLSALCGLLLLLSGCALTLPGQRSADAGRDRTLAVYRLSDDAVAGALTGQELCPLPEGAAPAVRTAVELFASPSGEDGLVCALPEGVTVEDWALENGALTLTLSENFLEASPMERTAGALCAALTFCGLEGVESVNVTAGGQTLFAGLTAADALLRDTDADPSARQLRLYFVGETGRYLVSENHSLTLDEDAAADRYVMEELLRGPYSPELSSALPEGTGLLSCATEDGVCTVDLSAEFYDARPETALGERLAVYSIVNSLTALPQVDSVRILVEGQPVERYVYRSLEEPLVRYDQAVWSDAAGTGTADVDLYLPLPGLEDVAPLPWQVDGPAVPGTLLPALLTAAEPGYPAVFHDGSLGGMTVKDGRCTVELTESFFASLPAEGRPAAIRSIAATVCALDGVVQVRFTLDGGPAVFDGTDWSGPWEGGRPASGG